MDNDFTIDSKQKKYLNKNSRLFHYVFGGFLFIIGLICIFKSLNRNDLLHFNLTIVIYGFCWILRGLIGKEIFVPNRFVTIAPKLIIYKNYFKKNVTILSDSITYLKLSPSKIEIVVSDILKTFDLSWITYIEFQNFKAEIDSFCKRNDITMND